MNAKMDEYVLLQWQTAPMFRLGYFYACIFVNFSDLEW